MASTRLSVPSSEVGPHTPSPLASVSPPLGPKGGREQHSHAGRGVGGRNSNDWIESLALCMLCEYHQRHIFDFCLERVYNVQPPEVRQGLYQKEAASLEMIMMSLFTYAMKFIFGVLVFVL